MTSLCKKPFRILYSPFFCHEPSITQSSNSHQQKEQIYPKVLRRKVLVQNYGPPIEELEVSKLDDVLFSLFSSYYLFFKEVIFRLYIDQVERDCVGFGAPLTLQKLGFSFLYIIYMIIFCQWRNRISDLKNSTDLLLSYPHLRSLW